MKVTNQACLQFLTTATTAMMATVLAQQDDGDSVISRITKPNNGQDNDIDQRSNQKPTSLFNHGTSSSSRFGHYEDTTPSTGSTTTTGTLAVLDYSFPNSDKVLRNNELKPCRDTQRNQDATNKDADTGILECGVNEYCLVLPADYDVGNIGIGRCMDETLLLSSHYNDNNNDMVPLFTPSFEAKLVHRSNELQPVGTPEVQQSDRRLVGFVCPPTMTNICPMSPVSLSSGDTLSCTGLRACFYFEVTFATGSTISCSADRACYFIDATGAGTMTCSEQQSCRRAFVTLQSGGQLVCDTTDACFRADVIYFDAGSTITCSANFACERIFATGAGTMTCNAYDSCDSAAVTLQSGGQLECDYRNACFGADVTFEGTALMKCLTANACAEPYYGLNNIHARASGGTLLCRAENSCLTSFFLNDYSFLLICEDAFSCAANDYTTTEGTASTCVVCVQENSCAALDDVFFSGGAAEKDQPQLVGSCTDDQISIMCNAIDPDLASTLDFGTGLVCVPSMSPTTSSQPSIGPSEAPTTSPQPSLAPTDMSKPSLAPFRKPSAGKKDGKKAGNGKKEGAGEKGGKKGHPNSGSKKAGIAKVENIAIREPYSLGN